MKLVVNWSDFKDTISNFISEGKSLNFPTSRNPSIEEYENVKSNSDSWIVRVLEYLDSAFDTAQNEYSLGFKQARKERFNVNQGQQNKKESYQLISELKEDLEQKISELEYTIRILEISDAIVRPEQISIVDRNNYSTQQTLNLILDKLYELYDNSYYSIVAILKGNGIEMKRNYEDRDFGKMLDENGYVSLTHRHDTYAQLTLEGKMFVEETRKSYIESYEDINLDKAQMDGRIDEIIERLNNFGLGQEILFDELQDLRETYLKLSKKSWGQLLKGKLIDLALGKVIENDTISYVYEKLTNHQLRLP